MDSGPLQGGPDVADLHHGITRSALCCSLLPFGSGKRTARPENCISAVAGMIK